MCNVDRVTLPRGLIQAVIPKRLHRFMGIGTSTNYGKARFMNCKQLGAFLSPRHHGLVLGYGAWIAVAPTLAVR